MKSSYKDILSNYAWCSNCWSTCSSFRGFIMNNETPKPGSLFLFAKELDLKNK